MEGQKAGKKEKQKVKQDMGSGSIPRLMLNLAIPAVGPSSLICCTTLWTEFI